MSENTKCANNAQFFHDPRVAESAFRKWQKATGGSGIADFLCNTRISTALAYDIGEIVKVPFNGEIFYTQVLSYDHGYNSAVLDRFSYCIPGKGNTRFTAMVSECNRDEYRTRIPAELLELAKEQVRAEMAASASAAIKEGV